MGIELQRGGNVTLSRIVPVINGIFVGAGWNIRSAGHFDLDVSCFMVGADGKVRNDRDFIFYNQTTDSDLSVKLDMEPPNNTDMRAFHITLSKIPMDIQKVIISITMDQADDRKQNLAMVDGLYVRILDTSPFGQELIRYTLDDATNEIAVLMGELYRYNNEWKFRAVGQGYSSGLNVLASTFGVHVNALSEEVKMEYVGLRRKRRTSNQIFSDNALYLRNSIKQFFPQVQQAVNAKLNESNTRMILDKMFMDVFGYKMEEIKAEEEIHGRKADYVLSIDNENVMVVEAKRAGMTLRDQQIFQATSYGAYSGIRWALLTNLITWQIYRISAQDKIEANLVFSIDLTSDIEQSDAECLTMISRYGMSRKGLLEKFWNESCALSRENIIRAVLREDVIDKVRKIIKQDTRCAFTNDQIQQAIERAFQIS